MEPDQGPLRAVIFLLAAGAENLQFPKDNTAPPSSGKVQKGPGVGERNEPSGVDDDDGRISAPTRDREVPLRQPTQWRIIHLFGAAVLHSRCEGDKLVRMVNLGWESWRFALVWVWIKGIRSHFHPTSS